MPTISELINRPPVRITKFYIDDKNDAIDPALVFGLELEIENANQFEYPRIFEMEQDGSLRNNGREFISRPAKYNQVVKALKVFYKANNPIYVLDEDGLPSDESNFSDRTSVHVHTNVLDLNPQQIAALLVVYQVFERVLYNFAQGDRDKNIFCVPLNETLITARTIKTFMEGNIDKAYDWYKYTGLNILPITTQGTVEWRHLPGVPDVKKIISWLRIISAIYRFIRINDFDTILNTFLRLNSNSQYARAVQSIFYDVPEITNMPGMDSFLEQGVLDLKFDWSFN